MVRRVMPVPESPSAGVVVPADIAAGPDMHRWASPESLDVLAGRKAAPSRKGLSQQLRDAEGAAMVSAWCRWRDARNAWFTAAGLTVEEGATPCTPGARTGARRTSHALMLARQNSVDPTTPPQPAARSSCEDRGAGVPASLHRALEH